MMEEHALYLWYSVHCKVMLFSVPQGGLWLNSNEGRVCMLDPSPVGEFYAKNAWNRIGIHNPVLESLEIRPWNKSLAQ